MIINRAIRQMSGFIYERRKSAGEMNRSRRRGGGKKSGGGGKEPGVNSAFARHPPTRRAIYRRYNAMIVTDPEPLHRATRRRLITAA